MSCRKTTLTIEVLTKHALKPDQRLRLETEARTGEFKIEQAKAKSEQELLQFLGKPSALPSGSFGQKLPESTDRSQLPSPPPRSSKRIGRAAHRPLRGRDGIPGTLENAEKCSFLSPIGVTVQQFQESGVWHVECQHCGARRDMKKVKDRQKFPSHPPRKTLPPKGEERWVLREGEWKLVKD